jgi:flagellar biosynthesis protein FlhA
MALGPQITSLCTQNSIVNAIVLEPALEQDLASHIQITEHGRYLGNSAEDLERVITSVQNTYMSAEAAGKSPVLVCSSYIRPALRRLIHTRLVNLKVISAAEVAANAKISTIGVIYHVANTTV